MLPRDSLESQEGRSSAVETKSLQAQDAFQCSYLFRPVPLRGLSTKVAFSGERRLHVAVAVWIVLPSARVGSGERVRMNVETVLAGLCCFHPTSRQQPGLPG